jgi:hypothetical protein
MEIRDRLLGPIASVTDPANDTLVVDFGDLVRKLILSERFILESNRLREIPGLVRKFGYDGVTELLRSGRVRILVDALTVGSVGHFGGGGVRPGKQPLPPGSYSFGMVRLHAPKEVVHQDLLAINRIPGLSDKQAKKLRKLVAERLVELPESRGNKTIDALHRDLEANAPLLKTSVAIAARQEYGRTISPTDFELRIERIDEQDWRSETDLGSRANLTDARVHKVVEHGLLGAGGLNLRIEYMELYNAVTGIRVNELPLMEEKLGFLARQLDPDAQLERFERVIELLDLPDAAESPEVHDIDMMRLLQVLEDDRTRHFRQWLRGVDSLDDEDVQQEIHRMRDFMSRAVLSPGGRTVRFLATTGAGFVPVPGLGIAASALDSFLIDKVVPEPGPTAFLSQLYPSVFVAAT